MAPSLSFDSAPTADESPRMDMMDYSAAIPRLLEAVNEESEYEEDQSSSSSSTSSASIRSISLDTPEPPTPPPKSRPVSTAAAVDHQPPQQENQAPPLIPTLLTERKASWRDWLGLKGPAVAEDMEELADAQGPPSPAISDTPSTPGGAGPFPYAFLQDPQPERETTSSMLVHADQSSTTTSTRSRGQRKKQYLLTVVPSLNLSTDSPRLKKRALSKRGALIPLHSSYHRQLTAIAHEYRLPSIDDIALFLLSTSSSIKSASSSLIPSEDGPRIGEAAWKVLWEDLFDDDEAGGQHGRSESFSESGTSASDAYLSPLPPPTPSGSAGLFGSYSFFSSSPSVPQHPTPLSAPHLKRSKSTPTSSPYLVGGPRRLSGEEEVVGGAYGTAVVVGRVEFDLEPSSHRLSTEEDSAAFPIRIQEQEQDRPSALTSFLASHSHSHFNTGERRRSSGTSAAASEPGFPSFERRRSSGTSASSEGGGGKRAPREWAKRRGSTKPVMRSEEEVAPPMPLPLLTREEEPAPTMMIPSPPRWSPALSRGLFTPVEMPSDSPSLPLAETQPLKLSSSNRAHLSNPSSSSSPNPLPQLPSSSSTPSSSHTNSTPSPTHERRPSVSVNLASFLGNVASEEKERMEAVSEELELESQEEREEVGLGVFGVPTPPSRDGGTRQGGAAAGEGGRDRPDSQASSASALELVDTLEALQEALGFDSESRRPSNATTASRASEASRGSRGSEEGGRGQGHGRSQSTPPLLSTANLSNVNPFANTSALAPEGGQRRPRKALPRSTDLAGDNPHRWSTVSPRNSAFLPTPSRAAPAPPPVPLPRVSSPSPTPTPQTTATKTAKEEKQTTTKQQQQSTTTPLLGRFSLDSGRPRLSDLASSSPAPSTPNSNAEPKSTPTSSMWSTFPKFGVGGLFGSKATVGEVEFTEVLAAPSPSATDSPGMEEVPMPGKTPRPRAKSLSKKFASFRSTPLPSSTSSSGEVATVTSLPRQHSRNGHSSSSSSSTVSNHSNVSLVLSPHAVSAVTNQAPARRGSTVNSNGDGRGYKVGEGEKPRFEVELRSSGKGDGKRKELPKDVLRAMI